MHRRFALIVVLSLSLATTLSAQETSRVVIAGGLLGQTEGFPELPSSPGDLGGDPRQPVGRRIIGGVDGLRRWLIAAQTSSRRADLLLLGGENLPLSIGSQTAAANAFMARLEAVAALQPTAAALGTQDIVRFLRGASLGQGNGPRPAPAAALESWLASSPIQFMASNAAITLTRKGLNVVSSGDVTLQADENVSIGWEKELKVERPCRLTPAFSLSTGGAPIAIVTKPDPKTGNAPCRSTITLAGGRRLQPGRKYDLAVTGAGTSNGVISVHTHRALTPSKVAAAEGFPIGAPATARDPWVLALVDPDIVKQTGKSPLEWRCVETPKTTCRLTFLPAARTVSALLDVITAQAPGSSPFVALLSSMPDAATSEVLGETSLVRLVVLPPDSGLLGVAADGGSVKITPAGGAPFDQPLTRELRSAGLIEGRDPSTSALLARPEWVAETIVEVSVTHLRADPWRSFQGTTFGTPLVFGSSLCWSPGPNPGEIAYSLESPDASPFETHRAYASGSAGTRFPKGGLQHDLWVDPAEFAAAAMDVMRDQARTELALVPESLVDEDAVAWLAYVRDELRRPLDWLSRLTLERVLYGADGYVRAVVPGKDLVATVNKILQSRDGEQFCAAGFGQAGCGMEKLDADALFLNGRHVDDTHYYSLALFRSIADEQGLRYDHGDVHDIVEDLDRRLRQGTPAAVAKGCTSQLLNLAPASGAQEEPQNAHGLAKELEERHAGLQSYVRLNPMKIGFATNDTTLPDGGNSTLLGSLIEGAKPKDYRRWQVDADGDLGFLDARRWAIRGVGSLEYQEEEVANAISIDKDEFTLGARADYKVHVGNRTGRVFGGRFVEGGLKGRPEKAASARILEQIKDPNDASRVIQETVYNGPELTYRTKPRRYRYWAVGAELAGWSPGALLKVTQFAGHYDLGTSENELESVLLNGEPLPLTSFLKDGDEAMLKAYFTAAGRNPDASDRLDLRYSSLDQRRVEINFDTEHAFWKIDGKDVKVTNEFRLRKYWQSDPVAYSVQWSVREGVGLTLPVWSRLSVVLKSEWDVVDVNAVSQAFKVFRFTAAVELPLFGKHAGRGLFFR